MKTNTKSLSSEKKENLDLWDPLKILCLMESLISLLPSLLDALHPSDIKLPNSLTKITWTKLMLFTTNSSPLSALKSLLLNFWPEKISYNNSNMSLNTNVVSPKRTIPNIISMIYMLPHNSITPYWMLPPQSKALEWMLWRTLVKMRENFFKLLLWSTIMLDKLLSQPNFAKLFPELLL